MSDAAPPSRVRHAGRPQCGRRYPEMLLDPGYGSARLTDIGIPAQKGKQPARRLRGFHFRHPRKRKARPA